MWPPLLLGSGDGLVDQGEPVGEGVEEDGAVQRLLGREVVQEARTPDADLVGDVVQARAAVPVLGEPVEGDLENEGLGALAALHRDGLHAGREGTPSPPGRRGRRLVTDVRLGRHGSSTYR